jgi:ISXO2 transposase-like protein
MHRSRLPLSKWLLASYFVTVDKRGLSALQLSKQLGIGYEAAWAMLHKLRAAMVAPGRTLLAGTVEVDETFLGSPPRGRTRAPEKMTVLGSVEVRLHPNTGRHYPGRCRLRHVPKAHADAVDAMSFLMDTVEPGSIVVTDASSIYAEVDLAGYKRSIESTAHGMKQDQVLRLFHTMVSNLKAWLAGTHHGAVGGKHLQAYLNEYVFRYDRRRNQQAAFQRVLGLATSTRGPEIEQFYIDAGEPGGWPHPVDRSEDAPD